LPLSRAGFSSKTPKAKENQELRKSGRERTAPKIFYSTMAQIIKKGLVLGKTSPFPDFLSS